MASSFAINTRSGRMFSTSIVRRPSFASRLMERFIVKTLKRQEMRFGMHGWRSVALWCRIPAAELLVNTDEAADAVFSLARERMSMLTRAKEAPPTAFGGPPSP